LVASETTVRRGFLVVLLRLAYLGVANALSLLRLPPMSDRAKDVEILAVRHQIMILERQLNGHRVQFTSADRALLAGLLHRLPRTVLRQIRLLVRPAVGVFGGQGLRAVWAPNIGSVVTEEPHRVQAVVASWP
jgi:hypothetical protein